MPEPRRMAGGWLVNSQYGIIEGCTNSPDQSPGEASIVCANSFIWSPLMHRFSCGQYVQSSYMLSIESARHSPAKRLVIIILRKTQRLQEQPEALVSHCVWLEEQGALKDVTFQTLFLKLEHRYMFGIQKFDEEFEEHSLEAFMHILENQILEGYSYLWSFLLTIDHETIITLYH